MCKNPGGIVKSLRVMHDISIGRGRLQWRRGDALVAWFTSREHHGTNKCSEAAS